MSQPTHTHTHSHTHICLPIYYTLTQYTYTTKIHLYEIYLWFNVETAKKKGGKCKSMPQYLYGQVSPPSYWSPATDLGWKNCVNVPPNIPSPLLHNYFNRKLRYGKLKDRTFINPPYEVNIIVSIGTYFMNLIR